MKSFTALIVTASILSSASGFTPPSSSIALLTLTPRSNTISLTSISSAPENFSDVAETISDAARSLRGQTVVVKYGGNAMTSPELKAGFCQDVVILQNLGVRILVVHGGGPQINAMLEQVGVESRFEGGMRVSSKEVVDVAEMVLCGSVNKEISSTICSAGGRAIGLSGRDDSLLQCVKKNRQGRI